MITKNEENYLKYEEQRPIEQIHLDIKAPDMFHNYFPALNPTLPDPEPIAKIELRYEGYDELHYMPFQYQDINCEEGRNIHQFYDHSLFQMKPNYFGDNIPFYEKFEGRIKKEDIEIDKDQEKPILKEEYPEYPAHQYPIASFKREDEAEQSNFHIKYPDLNQYFCLLPPKLFQDKSIIRRKKVQAYLEKKKQRSYSRKVIYKCRKDVADGRIRYKGRFLSVRQASIMLGLNPGQNLSPAFLKQQLSKLDKKKT